MKDELKILISLAVVMFVFIGGIAIGSSKFNQIRVHESQLQRAITFCASTEGESRIDFIKVNAEGFTEVLCSNGAHTKYPLIVGEDNAAK